MTGTGQSAAPAQPRSEAALGPAPLRLWLAGTGALVALGWALPRADGPRHRVGRRRLHDLVPAAERRGAAVARGPAGARARATPPGPWERWTTGRRAVWLILGIVVVNLLTALVVALGLT